MFDYRQRIYKNYLTTSCKFSAPDDLDSLKPRYYLYNMVIGKYFLVDRNTKVLDLGCGHGAFVHFLRLAGYSNVVGIDYHPNKLKNQKGWGFKVFFKVIFLDFYGLPLMNSKR